MSMQNRCHPKQLKFDTVKVQSMFFNGARAFMMAYWIAMHLRQLFKPPRLKQLPWSNKLPIEYGYWNSPVHCYYTSCHHNEDLVRKLVRCHATALRFLLKLFEVLRRQVLVVIAVVKATDRSCGGNGVALMARIMIDFEYFSLTIEWPTKLSEDCGCCGVGAVVVFVFQLNNIRDKCWGLVEFNMMRGK